MNIGIFTDTYLPDINGVVTSICMLKKSLERLGHKVYVITNHSGLTIKEEPDVLRLPGVKLKMLYGYNLSGPIHQKATEIIKGYDLDIIHLQTNFGVGIYGQTLAHHLGIPCITTYHTMFEDYTHYLNPLNLQKVDKVSKEAVRKLSKLICNYVQAVISPSEKTRESLEEYGVHAPIYVVPTGLDLDNLSPQYQKPEITEKFRKHFSNDKNARFFLYLGRMADEKGVDMVIRAFGNSGHNDWHLVLTGDGPELEEYKELAAKQPLAGNIHFTGSVPSDHVARIYGSCDAYVSASLSETQGMTYLEALASGKMVFGRRDPVLSKLIDEGISGYYFDDEKELIEKCEQFVKLDKEQLEKNAKACVEKAAPYSSESFGKSVDKVYQESLKSYLLTYKVEKAKERDDFIELVLSQETLPEHLTLWVPLEDYFELQISKYARLEHHQVLYYQNNQLRYKTYYQAKRKAQSKDMSTAMMRDYLRMNSLLGNDPIDGIIDELVDRGIINNKSYAFDHAISWHDKGYSKKQVAIKLTKKGIEPALVEQALEQLYSETEERNALNLARKLARKARNQSAKLKKQAIYQKLLSKGFSRELAQRSLDQVDIEVDDRSELKNCYEKACRLYRNLDKEAMNKKIRLYCLKKGFGMNEINELMEQSA